MGSISGIWRRGSPRPFRSNYYPNNDPGRTPRASWRSHGHLLFANWLNYYVYQLTSYRVEDIGKVFTYNQGGN